VWQLAYICWHWPDSDHPQNLTDWFLCRGTHFFQKFNGNLSIIFLWSTNWGRNIISSVKAVVIDISWDTMLEWLWGLFLHIVSCWYCCSANSHWLLNSSAKMWHCKRLASDSNNNIIMGRNISLQSGDDREGSFFFSESLFWFSDLMLFCYMTALPRWRTNGLSSFFA